MANINCPTCGQLDQVKKVSAIVADGITSSSGTTKTYVAGKEFGYWEDAPYSGTQITDLAIRLARPEPPDPVSRIPDPFSPIGCLFVIGLLLIVFACTVIVLAVYESQSNIKALAIAFVSLGLGSVTILGIQSIFSHKKRKMQDMLPRWKQADIRWHQLFYCFRDDTVFNPQDGKSMPTDDMEEYLYS